METQYPFHDDQGRRTTFIRSGDEIRLSRLCGMDLASPTVGPAPALLALECTDAVIQEAGFSLLSCQAVNGASFQAHWQIPNPPLNWHSTWSLDLPTGVWNRQDALSNPGDQTLRITRALARFTFQNENLRFYIQKSAWARENQGEWISLFASEVTLQSQAGRTNQGASPYLFATQPGTGAGLALHLLPRGNWVIHLRPLPEKLCTLVELGLTDADLRLNLAPGDTFSLPEILVQPVPSTRPEAGAPILHQYVLERFFSRQASLKPAAPLVYNTWFDTFEALQPERLRRQLDVAREVGCEVFVVDAGWYGNGRGPWDRQVGDWSEKRESAFQGRMRQFAEEVRRAGLGFGLWMEPERLAAGAPALSAHPDWFVACPYDYFRPDLSREPARRWLLDEISRLVETYELAWMKIDFNLEMGAAADGLAGYYQAWYELLDRLRARFPATFFEGCASGGMRLDLNTLAHFDGHFLSDTVNPLDMLRITQGALLRIPPGRLTRWAVLRPAGSPGQVEAPGGAGWEKTFPAEVDFICRAALPGMYGYSGDLAGLSPQVRQRLREHSEFYKQWRGFITASICRLLTPIQGLGERAGWVAFQLQNPPGNTTGLLFAYRLDDEASRQAIHLEGLDPARSYRLADVDPAMPEAGAISGSELMERGFTVHLPGRFSAGIWVVRPA